MPFNYCFTLDFGQSKEASGFEFLILFKIFCIELFKVRVVMYSIYSIFKGLWIVKL